MVRRWVTSVPRVNSQMGEALALNTLRGYRGALKIGHIMGIIAEIEFAKVTLQMLGADPLVIARGVFRLRKRPWIEARKPMVWYSCPR